MFDGVFTDLMGNAAIRGAVIAAAIKLAYSLLKKQDQEDIATKIKPWLQPLMAVLSALIVVGEAAQSNSLESLNLQAAIDWIIMFIGMRAAPSADATKAIIKAPFKGVRAVVKSFRG